MTPPYPPDASGNRSVGWVKAAVAGYCRSPTTGLIADALAEDPSAWMRHADAGRHALYEVPWRPTMSDRTLDEQLTKYLTDVHSIEVQALAQMKAAPEIAGDERLAAAFREHLDETREQERLVEH